MMMTDPFELIKAMPPSSALYGRAGESSDKLETCILIREDEKQIRKIPPNPIIELRSSLWESKVCLVVLMVKIASLPYETWWNYHQEGGGEKYFDDMIYQTMIPILVYDDRQMRRSIGVRNSLATSFKKYKERIQSLPSWSMKEFDRAREKIYAHYPNVISLWETLGADISQA